MNIVFGFIFFFFIEELVEYIYKRKYESSADRFKHMPDQIEICNIGSGPVLYAIDYNICDMVGFNMSTAPQNFQYGLKILKHYKNKIKENAIIIIVIMCPMSFGKNNEYLTKGYGDTYYGVLPSNEIDGYSISRKWMLKHPLLKRVISKLLRVIKKSTQKINTQKIDEPSIISVWKKEFTLADLKNPYQARNHIEVFKEKQAIVKEIIDYCYSNSWKPILVIPPLPKKTRQYISDDFLNEFIYKNINKVITSFHDIRVLDYYSDIEFDGSCFQDDVFMNEKGKKKFSYKLFMDIAN